jgi:hypothetical protein
MVKEFINWVARAKLRADVREMERTLNKMERLYNNLKTNDFTTFSLAFSIDSKIQECQEIMKGLKHRVKELGSKIF